MTILLLIALWPIIILEKASYYLYLWQIKEYRFDRMVAQLKEPGGASVIFSKSFYGKILLLIASVFFESGLAEYALLALYILESLFIIYRIVFRKSRYPVTTAKSVVLFALSVSIPFAAFFSIEPRNLLSLLLIMDLALPLVVTFWVLAFKPLSFLGKQLIVYRAKKKRERMKNLIAIAITGSFGKTSTKEFLATILSKKFRVAKTKNHQNTEVGAARAILSMPYDTQAFVAEEAAYRKGDIKEISEVVKPTIGVITGIGSQHLALFGSQEAIVETKFELANALPKGGMLIVNWDDERVRSKVKDEKFKVLNKKYSIKDKSADVFANDIDETLEGSFFTMHYRGKYVRTETSLLGRHSVSNVLAASAAALGAGMSLEEIAKAIGDVKPLPRTLEPKQGIMGSFIIDDTYNASLEGVLGALETLLLSKGGKILVFTSIIELGAAAKGVHKKIGEAIEKAADFAIIVDERHKEELQSKKTIFMKDPQKVIEKIKSEISMDSVVLLEGRIPSAITNALCKK